MNTSPKDSAESLLKRWARDPDASFRPGQWEAIEALVERRTRMLLVERTGWGKSLIYFAATHLLREKGYGPTLIVSPLLSLMRNQVELALRSGIRTASINSTNRRTWERTISSLRRGATDMLIVSPERLGHADFQNRVLHPLASEIGLLVVDEAHCIFDWGHDFRPDYRRIRHVLDLLPPDTPVLATTATANDRVVRDVMEQLGPHLEVVRGPLDRRSLHLQTIILPSQAARLAWLAEHVPPLPGSGIIYTLTVRDAERVSEWLGANGINAPAYHSELDEQGDDRQRRRLERMLLSNQVKALVATVALGMGFDKPDIGFVIHFQRPGSVVHYYQQVGRAGRSLDRSYGILLHGAEDDDITDYFIRRSFPLELHVEEVLRALSDADDGMTTAMIESRTNLTTHEIERVLTFLVAHHPPPVLSAEGRWHRTRARFRFDRKRVMELTEMRREEQRRMAQYVLGRTCLMAMLRRELDDPTGERCGRCAVCRGGPLVPESYSDDRATAAVRFLRCCDAPIPPRDRWPPGGVADLGWRGVIPFEARAEEGRALAVWGDAGWGNLVRLGKQSGRFDDQLVDAARELIADRWKPHPPPEWVTCIPSRRHPTLVPDYAERLAARLGLPFAPSVRKVRKTQPQKSMNNSYRQANNVAGSSAVEPKLVRFAPVLLVDDMVDSGWTFTVAAVLLRCAGSGPVFPFALAVTTAK